MTPMRTVPVWSRSIDDYRSVVSNEAVNALHRRAWEIPGLRVLHLNSTAYGGGVAELLLAQVPLLQSLGVNAEWRVIEGDDEFFHTTKAVHTAIQGNREVRWTQRMHDHYVATQERNAANLDGQWDVVVVHDPQPLAIPAVLGPKAREVSKYWVWRCHIDCQDPNPQVWTALRGYLDHYDALVFTMPDFVQPDVPAGVRTVVSAPSIDPMSPKNAPLAPITVTDICSQYRIDPRRPVISQVSRFDPAKDPHGVVEAYQMVKEDFPDLQLLLAGSLAHDDPEGLVIYHELLELAKDDQDIFVLSNFQEVGNTAVNCFQRASQVVIQKSLREGFGLTVAEAAWKGKPVVGGDTGGIRLQVADGVSGYLVSSVADCAKRVTELLTDQQQCQSMGEAGREFVREKFLTPRELSDWLDLFADLARA